MTDWEAVRIDQREAASELAMNMGGSFAILNGLSREHDWYYAGKDVAPQDVPNVPPSEGSTNQ